MNAFKLFKKNKNDIFDNNNSNINCGNNINF